MTIQNMESISKKIATGVRLSEDDALWLYKFAPLEELGSLANQVNLQKNGLAVFYNVNRHINPTNICSLSCKFCAYSKKLGEEGGYAYEIPEMIEKAREAIKQGATELHMVGGLHPRWGYQRYIDMIAALRKEFPEIHLKAFTAVELDWMARKARKSVKTVMEDLRDAGLNSFPGGGAEIFHEEIRDQICETKVSGDQWIDIHRTAHSIGMRSNCTMLYGHIENYEHRVDHMRRLRVLQDETNGFNVFIPLSFQPFQNEMGIKRYTFGADDLRNIAVSRLYLDNFKNIKAYWVMLGQDIAQLAMSFGANDIDGTVLEEKISRAAGGRSGVIMTRSNLESLIRRSGRIPVERTTLYQPVQEEDRKHLVPAREFGESFSTADDLLQRIVSGSLLSSHETWTLATSASLLQLGQHVSLAKTSSPKTFPQILKERIVLKLDDTIQDHNFLAWAVSKISSALEESISKDLEHIELAIHLDKGSSWDISSLLKEFTSAFPKSPIVLVGLKNLKNSFFTSTEPYEEHLKRLREFNVIACEESDQDVSLPLSTDRLAHIKSCLNADLKSAVHIELKGLDNGVDWQSFSEDLVAIRSVLGNKLSGVVTNLISTRHQHTIMPSEFLSAVAIARLILGSDCIIYCPIQNIATLAPVKGLGASQTENPALKLVSTLSAFGANGVGAVPLGEINPNLAFEDLVASGSPVKLNEDHSNSSHGLKAKLLSCREMRHIPAFAFESVSAILSSNPSLS